MKFIKSCILKSAFDNPLPNWHVPLITYEFSNQLKASFLPKLFTICRSYLYFKLSNFWLFRNKSIFTFFIFLFHIMKISYQK